MINEILWIVLMIVTFIGILVAYRFFGKIGLYSWMAVAIILANIQVMKTVRIFFWVTALGNVVYGTTFLVTDILSENYGLKEAKKAVWLGFFMMIAVTIIMQICLAFVPDVTDTLNPALVQIFSLLPRITIASLIAYIVSQLHDVWAFEFWKKIFKGRYLWLRNNFSTVTSQLIDNIIFTWIAFVGFFGLFGWEQVFSWSVIMQIFVVSYVMKFIVSLADTPFIYLSKAIKNRYYSKD